MNFIVLIVIAIFLGNLESLLHIIYLGTTNWFSTALKLSNAVFVVIHPLSYSFIFFVYTLTHPSAEKTFKDKLKYLFLAPLFAFLMYFRLLPYLWFVHRWFIMLSWIGSTQKMRMLSMENLFWISIINEFILQTLPIFIT